MDKRVELDKEILALNPKFREKIEELFKNTTPFQKKYVSWLYDLATHDEKTGLYNNKFFDTVLEMEMEKAWRGQQKLCLFMIDIDFFKKINDKMGHIKADELLVRLSELLKKHTRGPDVVARFGGEEFLILLPYTNLEKAKMITSRLRDIIKADPFLKENGMTVSGGLTEYKDNDTKETFKDRADKALYKAKNTGRDKFLAFE